MPKSSLRAVVQHLRAAVGQDGGGRSDGELLTHFLSRRDEAALAALVERHAPMVWGVCRRILRHPHDAEDAFQATFLVLVQKAATVVPRDMVANWLHGVARQTAMRLRTATAKRGWREVQMPETPEPPAADTRDDELLSRLDEELGRLPERSRVLIVLCDLQGRTRKEVAVQLGCPEGTVASGLARARELLAKRLSRRGLAVSGGSLAAALSHSAASADVPAAVVTSTINVATLLAAGTAVGVISGPVATLTQGVLKTMFLKKIMSTAAVVLAFGVAVISGGSLAVGQADGKPVGEKGVKAPVPEKPVEPAAKVKKGEEPVIAWGEVVGGLQAGLSFKAGDKGIYQHGEAAKFVVKVRNVGKASARVEYYNTSPLENPPAVTDTDGRAQPVQANTDFSKRIVFHPVLKPGDELDIQYDWTLVFQPATDRPAEEQLRKFPTLYGTGKFRAQVQLTAMSADDTLTELGKIATGNVELEVKEKEAVVAWGEVVGGLQAGLSFKAGEPRVYRHGEVAKLVVKVRNVGKQEVQVRSSNTHLYEEPPTVTDDAGKSYTVEALRNFTSRFPLRPVVAPRKEIELNELSLKLRPASEASDKSPVTLYGAGKFLVQFPSVGTDPGMNKLPTGVLALVVTDKPAEPANPINDTASSPLHQAQGMTYTLLPVEEKGGVLSWVTPVVTTKQVPVVVDVIENGVPVTKTVQQVVTTTESKKVEGKVEEVGVLNADGKGVSAGDASKRWKGRGTLVLLRNMPNDDTRKLFAADALFALPSREKGEDRPTAGNPVWEKLSHESGLQVVLVRVKAKGGVLTWSHVNRAGKVETVVENGVPVTRQTGYEEKVVEKEAKLADLSITDVDGKPVAAADIEKRFKEGGVLARSATPLGNGDRKLFATNTLFLEPPLPAAGTTDAKPKPAAFTIKDVTIDEVDTKAGVISVSFGSKEKPTKLLNVPLGKGVRVVPSFIRPGGGSHFPPPDREIELQKGKVVSLRLVPTADGLAVVSISSGND
jgi:RNA polymerase sigma factor (sigma-70 family)